VLTSACVVVAEDLHGKTFVERDVELQRLDGYLLAMRKVHAEMIATADRRLRPNASSLVRWHSL
jgi:hypothetical protein